MFKVRALLGTIIAAVLIAISVTSPVQAAPGNDRIGAATALTLVSNAASGAFTTAQASRENGEYLGSDASFQNTVWYLWDPTVDQQATISNCSASAASRLFVYEVNATTSSEPTSAPTKGTSSNCTNGNSISIVVSAAKFYYIQVVSKVTVTGNVVISTVALPSYTTLSKVTICHRTHATTNPYRAITVSVASIVDNNSAPNGHAHHNTDKRRVETDGPAGVFRPGFAYPSNAKHWGDIIPPFKTAGGGIFEGLNWTWASIITDSDSNGIFSRTEFATQVSSSGSSAAGDAAVAFCTDLAKSNLTSKQLYDFEREAGVDKSEILEELQNGLAEEDEATKTALGGSFETPTADAPGFARPVPPTANVNRNVTTTKSKTVKFTVNFNESVSELNTSDFETTGDASGCSVGNVSAASGASVEVTVTCASKGTVGLKLKKNGAKGGTDIGPELDQLSTNTTIEDEDPTPSASPSASPSQSTPGNSNAVRGGPTYKGNKAPKQSLSGVVWADLNQNGVQDSGEPLLADITCTCQLKFLATSPMTSLAGFLGMSVGPRFATTTTVKTNSQGQYLLKNAAAGEWSTTCTSPAGMTVTFDSTGTSDGVSTATIPDGGTGFTWVGLVGSSTITTTVTDPSGAPASGEVVIRWVGPDGKVNTVDDVNFTTTAIDGVINLSGLPAGTYYVRTVNGLTVTAKLTLNQETTFVNALATKKSSTNTLAATGINASLSGRGLIGFGFSLILFGAVSLLRRKQQA